MDMEKLKNNRLEEEQLDQVAGGGWGYNDFHNESAYESCGIQCNWTKSPFSRDKFIWKGKELLNNEASAIVFFTLKNNRQPNNVAEALSYKAQQGEKAYEDFCDHYNDTH